MWPERSAHGCAEKKTELRPTDGSRQFYYATSGQMQRIVSGSANAEFWFGAGHERVIQEKTVGSGKTATVYLGALVEFTAPVNSDNVTLGAATEIRYYVMTPLGRTAVRTETPSAIKVETRWLHSDALGSVVAVTNEWGQLERRYTYDAWGRQSAAYTMAGPGSGQTTGPTLAANGPARGYTDHKMLADFGLIHMNGRVYDPVLGRFLSADPLVDDAGDGQSYNRYSYVSNNPLNHTDPSGFFKIGDAAKIAAIVVAAYFTAGYALYLSGGITGVAAGATATFGNALAALAGTGGFGVTLGGAVAAGAGAGFASGFAGSLLNGGSIGDAFKAGAIGAIVGGVSGGFSFEIGELAHADVLGFWGHATAHGVVQGAAAEATGGEFRHGFYAGFFSAASGATIQAATNDDTLRVVGAAAVGGTASALGGGKFANGAVSGAFSYHQRTPSDKIASIKRRLVLLEKLENMRNEKDVRFIANQRLISYLRLYRWSYELGDKTTVEKALLEAQTVNKRYSLGAIDGVDLMDEQNHRMIRERVDELDSGYSPEDPKGQAKGVKAKPKGSGQAKGVRF